MLTRTISLAMPAARKHNNFMSWIEKIRQKPQKEKIRIIWATILAAVVLLIALWVITGRISKNTPKDTTLFETIGKGVKDIRDNYKK